jgi:hypothetical protein
MTGSWITFVPALTYATFVLNSLPLRESRNIEYGVCHGRMGTVTSRTPMPGTITAS